MMLGFVGPRRLTIDAQEITSIDNDVKGKYNQYNQVKTNLTVLQKRQT